MSEELKRGDRAWSSWWGEVDIVRVTRTKLQVRHTTNIWNGRTKWVPKEGFKKLTP